MRSYLFYAVALMVAASIFVGCNSAHKANTAAGQSASTVGAETTYADGARRVTTSELAELIKNNEVFVVDVRDQASYDAGHIPGSTLIPASTILNHLKDLPKDKLIVTYCS